jgi:2-aminoadipate transaminase
MTHTCPETRWNDRFAQRTKRLKSSAIRELLKLTERPDMISFAGGLPAPEVFPLKEVEEASVRVLDRIGPPALQYGTTEGYLPLRELLVRHMERYGIVVGPQNVLITSGSQQALDLIGKCFLNGGDRIVVENPTYLGAVQAFHQYQAEFVTVPMDDHGMRTDLLEDALRTGPKFVYVLPNFHNPAGVTLPLERRERLVELAGHHGVPIIEDDPYGQLRYTGNHIPPIVKLDAAAHECDRGQHAFTGNVLYLSTMSKILAPGLRIAWVVGPESVIQKLVQLKQGADLHTSTYAQMVAYETAKGGFLDRHVKTIRELYGRRREAMLDGLKKHFPEGTRWTVPEGGLFLWVTLPEGMDGAALLEDAIERGVAFVPGGAFFANGGGENTFRLNFSYTSRERAEEGIRRLGEVIRARMGKGAAVEVGGA